MQVKIKGLSKFSNPTIAAIITALEKEKSPTVPSFLKMMCTNDFYHHGATSCSRGNGVDMYSYSCWNCNKTLSFNILYKNEEPSNG